MLNITEQTFGMGGSYSLRNLTVRPVPATVTPPLSAEVVTQAGAGEKSRWESQQEGQDKEQGALQRFLAEERKRNHPGPLDKAIQQAMTRMVSTRQAAERFLLGAGTLALGVKEEGQGVDAIA